MPELNPTLARLELLQAVADGAVWRVYPIGMVRSHAVWDRGPGFNPRRRTVTGRVDPLARAGLVQLGDPVSLEYKASRPYLITAAGLELLEATRG